MNIQQLEKQPPRSLTRQTRGKSSGREELSLVEIAKIAVDDVLELLTSQLKLARFELGADVQAAVKRFVPLALLIPIVFAGYLFGIAAIASLLSGVWGWTAALAIVAAAQLLVGGLGINWAIRGLRAERILERTAEDAAANLKSTVAAVSSPGGGPHV